MDQNRRCEARHAFIASAELVEENPGSRMDTRISDLSFNGCYVDTVNPLPDGTAVRLKIFTETHSFEAPATVVYSHAHLGIGRKFREVQPGFEEIPAVASRGGSASSGAGRIRFHEGKSEGSA
jgi:hypothetical protein